MTGAATLAVDGRQLVVNRYILKHQADAAVVYYWYQGRGRVVASEYRVKMNLLRDAALARHTEEALVRVVVPVQRASNGDAADAARKLDDASRLGAEVASRLERDVSRVLPRGT
jgi:EpsI family protein